MGTRLTINLKSLGTRLVDPGNEVEKKKAKEKEKLRVL